MVFDKSEKNSIKVFDAPKVLYFSMTSFAELYLSDNTKKEISKSVSRIIETSRATISRTKEGINNLLSKAEEGIEKLLVSRSQINAKNIEIQLSKNTNKKIDYAAKENPLAKFLKNMYGSFINYSKKVYGVFEDTGKKVDGFVKLTMYKICRMGEYIMALTTPQWNKVMGSMEDKDTYSMAISQKESISPENAKYRVGYEFLRYRA